MPTEPIQLAPTVDAIMKHIQELEDIVQMHNHGGSDRTQRIRNTLLNSVGLINDLVLGDGKVNPGRLTLKVAGGYGDTFIKAGTIADGDFTNTGAGAGFILGIDDSDSDRVKFYFGDATNNIQYDGNGNVTITGSITATTGTIGGFTIASDHIRDTANSMGIASTVSAGDDVRFWAGDTFANRATAEFRVTEAGAVTCTNITITGGSVAVAALSGAINSVNVNIANNNWAYSGAWSVTDADTVAWGAGTLTTAGGGSYSITGSNTGNMVAKTYIYFDIAVSTTAFQITTTAATAVGDGKVLIAIAQNGTNEANYIVVNDKQHNIDASDIVTGSITANEIATGTITAAKMNVTQLSAIAADLGAITAGSISINGGVASIDTAGAGIFKSVQIGGTTRQYVVGDDGIFNFGDGSDGDATISGDTTLTADKYYDDLVINTGVTLNPGRYRIFARTTTLNGTGKIASNGNNGGNGSDGSAGGGGGSAGAALADGYLKGSVAGGAGGAGSTVNGVAGSAGANGTATSNSLGSNGVAGGTGKTGAGLGGAGGAGGSAGVATAANVKLIANWHLATLLDVGATGATLKFDNSAGAGGGGGGGDNNGGGGGGSGSAGGIIAIYSKTITIGASASITANGGNGGNGGVGNNNGAGGGGGSGGNGGQIILVYNSLTNNGSLTVTAGTFGTMGASGTGGTNGNAGTAGNSSRSFQLSI